MKPRTYAYIGGGLRVYSCGRKLGAAKRRGSVDNPGICSRCFVAQPVACPCWDRWCGPRLGAR